MFNRIQRPSVALLATIVVAFAMYLTGCADKAIDGSSVEAFQASIEQWDLQGEERHAFGEALRFIAHDELSSNAHNLTPDQMQQHLAAALDGFTYEQVMAEYTSRREALEAAVEQHEQQRSDDEAAIEMMMNQGRTGEDH